MLLISPDFGVTFDEKRSEIATLNKASILCYRSDTRIQHLDIAGKKWTLDTFRLTYDQRSHDVVTIHTLINNSVASFSTDHTFIKDPVVIFTDTQRVVPMKATTVFEQNIITVASLKAKNFSDAIKASAAALACQQQKVADARTGALALQESFNDSCLDHCMVHSKPSDEAVRVSSVQQHSFVYQSAILLPPGGVHPTIGELAKLIVSFFSSKCWCLIHFFQSYLHSRLQRRPCPPLACRVYRLRSYISRDT